MSLEDPPTAADLEHWRTAQPTCPYCAVQGHRRAFGAEGCTHTQAGHAAAPALNTRRVVLLPNLGCGHCGNALTFDQDGVTIIQGSVRGLPHREGQVRCRCDTCGYRVAVPLQVLDLAATDTEEKST
jgi:hypothetical protein